MTNQQWIDGVFAETDTDYTIAGKNILYKNEEDYLVKGVELLCDELSPSSVLEFGFGKGWTASEFQRQGVTRHIILEPNTEVYQMALAWKANYSTDIEILNIFSWDYEGGETFDLVCDDRQQFTLDDNNKHEIQMKSILPEGQWFGSMASECTNKKASGYPIFYKIDDIDYIQPLERFGEHRVWQQ